MFIFHASHGFTLMTYNWKRRVEGCLSSRSKSIPPHHLAGQGELETGNIQRFLALLNLLSDRPSVVEENTSIQADKWLNKWINRTCFFSHLQNKFNIFQIYSHGASFIVHYLCVHRIEYSVCLSLTGVLMPTFISVCIKPSRQWSKARVQSDSQEWDAKTKAKKAKPNSFKFSFMSCTPLSVHQSLVGAQEKRISHA